MRPIRMLVMSLAALLCLSMLSLTARADEFNKQTSITFPEAVQIPGTVLPAGTYVFRLMNSDSNRHVVQVYNEDQTRIIASVIAISDYQSEPDSGTVIRMAERPSSQPQAVAEWFYPGDKYGQEFVYPNSGQQQFALVSDTGSPSAAGEPANSSPAYEQTAQENSSPAPDTTPQTQPNTSTTGQAESNTNQLPKTASPLPLIGATGLVLIAFGTTLVLRRKFRA